MILSQNIKNLILDKREKRIIHHRRVAEIDKINDPRRVKIAEMVQLSKEQKEAIDEVYMKNYGSKIPYIWHQYYTAYTGNFDPYYVPELLYIPEFERFMNIYPEYVKVFEDKNILPYAAKAAGIKMPTTILTYVCGLFRNKELRVISKEEAMSCIKDETLPELGCVNWDFTLDENGTPILIEANISDGSIWLSQMSNGVGAFGQDTPEILEWIHKMEGVKLSDRYKYRFGR